MIKLRSAGAASILTLLLVLALFTTGAFAQGVQVSKSASVHTAVVTHIASIAHNRLGGGGGMPPVTVAPAAPAVTSAPVVQKAAAPVVRHVHATAVAIAHSSDCIPFDGFWGGTSILNGCGFDGFGGFGGFGNFGGF